MFLPINALPRVPSPNTFAFEAGLLEDLRIPWPESRGAEENTTTDFEDLVQSQDLLQGGGTLGIEPVHRIHELW